MAVMRNSQEALLTIVEVSIFSFFWTVICQNVFSFLSLSSHAPLHQILILGVLY